MLSITGKYDTNIIVMDTITQTQIIIKVIHS